MTDTMRPETGERVDEAFARAFAQRWHDAWNAHDARSVQALCTEDVEVVDPSTSSTLRGHAAIEELLGALHRAFPDYRFTELEPPLVASDRPKAIAPWRFEGTFTGELTPPGFAPTGARVELRGDDHWEFRGERVARCEMVYDVNALAVAIGAAPPPGSRGERIGVWLQRLHARAQRRRA